MFHYLFHHHGDRLPPLGGGLLFNGLLCVLFGLAILAAPELLAYFVATLLIVVGASLLTSWWKLQQWRRKGRQL